jgi:two-component system nitrogen regulation response regulator GlnG
VIRLRLPALRERKEDVSMLTRHFLQQSAKQLGVEPKRISDSALTWLEGFGFPGNVRQLENICHWLTVMAPAQVIDRKDLPPEVSMGRGDAGDMALAAKPATPVLTEMVGKESVVATTSPSSTAASGMVESDQDLSHVLARAAAAHGPLEGWEAELETEAVALLGAGQADVWDTLTRRFESRLILAALANTKGRRIEAAQKLGIGRNTITRKIQELGLE